MSKSIQIEQNEKSVLLLLEDGGYLFDEGPKMVKDLIEKIQNNISGPEKLLQEGVDCELLQAGAPNWKKGKLQLRLQFVEEPNTESESETAPSALDDLRQIQDD